jgi:hypothetical protein
MTVPGPLNYRQPVTRWLLERQLEPRDFQGAASR